MATIEKPGDDLLNSLAYALAKNLPLLRSLAAKPKRVPGDEDCQENRQATGRTSETVRPRENHPARCQVA
jgi:hypothetical protein